MTRPPRSHGATADEIAREIARSRARLSQDLARLDREYALRHLIVRASRLAAGEHVASDLAESLKRNALPLTLMGLGVGWLTVAGRQRGGDLLHRLGEALAELQALAQGLRLLSIGDKAPPPTAPPAQPEP